MANATMKVQDAAPSGSTDGNDKSNTWLYGDLGYEVNVVVHMDEDGRLCGFVAQLPSAVSEGESIDEVIRNTVEALEGLLETYREQEMTIPWVEPDAEIERVENVKSNIRLLVGRNA